MKTITTTLIAFLIIYGQHSSAFAQGSLTPPGGPAPTMLTLSQVEPRTPVDSTHTPGNSVNEFIIGQSGSYYLTTNIAGVSGKDGIDILTNNVTLDLCGFSLLGVSSGFNEGIQIFGGCTNVIVHNGIISGWSVDGIFSVGNNVTFENLTLSGNFAGLIFQGTSTVRYCTVSGNKFPGISIEANNCLVFGNVLNGNNFGGSSGDGGIVIAGSNNRIEDNHVVENDTLGSGINIFNTGSPPTNNIIIRNSVEGNGANDYSLGSSQIAGPIITNVISGIITNSNPWANFAF